jgi:hypothetical protein
MTHGTIVRREGEIICKGGGDFEAMVSGVCEGWKKIRIRHYDHEHERVAVKLPKRSRSEAFFEEIARACGK